MPSFRITFFVEPEVQGDAEIEIEKTVEARDADEALDLARQLRESFPDIAPEKILAWYIEKTDT